MQKQEFIKLINELEELIKERENENRALNVILDNSCISTFLNNRPFNFIIKLLEKLFNDKGKIIEYYIYETDLGRDAKEVVIKDKVYILNSAEVLWELLNE